MHHSRTVPVSRSEQHKLSDQHTAATWKAALNSLLESGLLEEKEYSDEGDQQAMKYRNHNELGHNTLARAIKEFISNMDTNSVDSIHLNKQANYLMKTTSLPSVEEEGKSLGEYLGCNVAELTSELSRSRLQAYTSLVEGIEVALKRRFVTQPQEYKDSDANVWREGYNRALTDILENVVKPLYGKK
jgi:hypothetical protein